MGKYFTGRSMFAVMFMGILMVIVAVFSKPSVVFVMMFESVSLRPVVFTMMPKGMSMGLVMITMVPNGMSMGLVMITMVLKCMLFSPQG